MPLCQLPENLRWLTFIPLSIEIKPPVSQKTYERNAECLRGLHGQAGGRSHGAHPTKSRHRCFLHQLKTGPATQQQYMVVQRKHVFLKEMTDEFVQCIVTAYILPNGEQLSVSVEQRSSMQAARGVESRLRLA